jgi:hypothetical protein
VFAHAFRSQGRVERLCREHSLSSFLILPLSLNHPYETAWCWIKFRPVQPSSAPQCSHYTGRTVRTVELYDAVVPGNQAPWKKYFADDRIFADERTHSTNQS